MSSDLLLLLLWLVTSVFVVVVAVDVRRQVSVLDTQANTSGQDFCDQLGLDDLD